MIGIANALSGVLGGPSSGLSGMAVFHNTVQILMGQSAQSMVDVTAAFPPMSMITIHYTDPISFEADTLELTFSDIGDQIIKSTGLASQSAVVGMIKKGIWLQVIIDQWNRDYPGSHVQKDLGTFQLDQIKSHWPPSQVTFMATSVPTASNIKLTLQNKTRFAYNLQMLGEQVAKENGLGFVWNVPEDSRANYRTFTQVQQWNESDLQMYSRYLKSNALAMKIKNVNGRQSIVVFDEQWAEKQPPVYTIDFAQRGAGIELLQGELTTQSQDIYSGSEFAYFDSYTNTLYVGKADAPPDTADGSEANLKSTDVNSAQPRGSGEPIATQAVEGD